MAFAIKYQDPTRGEVDAIARIRRTIIETPAQGEPYVSVNLEVFASEDAKASGLRPLSGMDITLKDKAAVTKEVEKTKIDGTKERVVEEIEPATDVGTRAIAAIGEARDLTEGKKAIYGILGTDRHEFRDNPKEV